MVRKEEKPDQARSWAIAFAGCVINSLLSGISRANGLFYVALIDTYGITRMQANMPFTLRNGVRNLASPLAGAIGQRYGAREVTFVGGIFSFLGIALCFFAPDVTWISILWGGLHGFGVALGNTLFPVIINQYFLKYRATASGLALSGACIGSFVFPATLEYMLNNIGLSGTFLITGGFVMHVLPAAILMKEPPWVIRTQNRKRIASKQPSRATRKERTLEEEYGNISVKTLKKVSSSDLISNGKCAVADKDEQITRDSRVFSRSGVDNPGFARSELNLDESGTSKNKTEEAQKIEDEMDFLRIRTISIGETSVTFAESTKCEVQETSLTKGIPYLLKDPMFYAISFSLAGFAMLFDPAITVIVDYITDKGFQEDEAKYFIFMMSLGDLLGRLCFGWVTDRNYISVSKFMLLIQVIQGLCFILLPMFGTFEILMTIILVYGLASGATLVMFPILVSNYLASVQSLAIGFTAFVTGILSFAVPPLIGYFRDHAGSYDGMFLITGSMSIAAGVLWIFEPLLKKMQKRVHSGSIVISG